MLVVNKPAGIPTHPSISTNNISLANGVRSYFDKICLKKKIRPVNRLDIYTSGIVVFAKCEYIQECLISQMEQNIFKKEYLCFCMNDINSFSKSDRGKISFPLSRKPGSILERCINTTLGQRAITNYEVLEIYKKENINYCLIKCSLETR